MGIISLNEKRTATNPAHTTGREKSFFTSDQFREPPVAEVITTNLDIHYDFGDTNCWSGVPGTSTSNWRIYDLQGNHDAAIKRYVSGGWTQRSDSPLISKETTNGGCIQFDPDEWNDNYSRTAILVQCSFTASSTANWYVAANTHNDFIKSYSSSENILYGLGTSDYTYEFWIQLYHHSSDAKSIQFMNFGSHDNGGVLDLWNTWIYNANTSNAIRLDYDWATPDLNEYIDMTGTQSAGSWGSWQHVVVSRESTSSNQTKIYLNGDLEHSFTDSTSYRNAWTWIMCYYSASSKEKLRFGVFRFYKGKGLTATEVTNNWDAQKARFGY